MGLIELFIDGERVPLLPIPDLLGYYASADGRIFSNIRRNGRSGFRQLRLQSRNADGYLSFTAYGKSHWVHRCVALAWIGPAKKGMLACHNDNDVSNNASSNLRWDTQKGNMADKRANGTHLEGETHHSAKLSIAQVREIRSAYAARTSRNWGCTRFAKRFGVSASAVSMAAMGKNWKGGANA